MHRERLKNVKGSVDTSEPLAVQMGHVRKNLKRGQMLEERYSEIDRENHLLLKKMSQIVGPQDAQSTPRTERKPPGPVSLNRDARKKELLRITKDNASILKRIQQAQPVYNHVEAECVHKKNTGYLKNCSDYPLVLRTPPRSARGRPNGTSELVSLTEPGPSSGRSSSLPPPPQPQPQQASQRQPPQRSPPLPQQLLQEEQQEWQLEEQQDIPEQDEVGDVDGSPQDGLKSVLQESRRIGDTSFLVEMATDAAGLLHISAYDAEAQEQLELSLKDKTHRRLYRESNGDYAALAARLSVTAGDETGRRLMLV